MNKLLRKLYNTHKGLIYKLYDECGVPMEGPFLVSPSISYWENKLRVAFVGQETRGWSCEESIDAQMSAYEKFNLGEKYYASPFWNVVRKLERSLIGEEYSSVSLNLNRYDEGGGSPSDKNQKILSQADFLLLEELRILEPRIVIFLTGPSYDRRMCDLLGGEMSQILDWPCRQVCQVLSDKLTDTLIIRTYHPNYLRRSGLEPKILELVAGFIKSKREERG